LHEIASLGGRGSGITDTRNDDSAGISASGSISTKRNSKEDVVLVGWDIGFGSGGKGGGGNWQWGILGGVDSVIGGKDAVASVKVDLGSGEALDLALRNGEAPLASITRGGEGGGGVYGASSFIVNGNIGGSEVAGVWAVNGEGVAIDTGGSGGDADAVTGDRVIEDINVKAIVGSVVGGLIVASYRARAVGELEGTAAGNGGNLELFGMGGAEGIRDYSDT